MVIFLTKRMKNVILVNKHHHITEFQVNEFIINRFKINSSKVSLSTEFVGQNGYYSSKDIGYYFNTYIFPVGLLGIPAHLKKICNYSYYGFRGRLYIWIRKKE